MKRLFTPLLSFHTFFCTFIVFGVLGLQISASHAGQYEYQYNRCMKTHFGDIPAAEKQQLCDCAAQGLSGKTKKTEKRDAILQCLHNSVQRSVSAQCARDEDLVAGLRGRLPKFCKCFSSTAAGDFKIVLESDIKNFANPDEAFKVMRKMITSEIIEQNVSSAAYYCMEKL